MSSKPSPPLHRIETAYCVVVVIVVGVLAAIAGNQGAKAFGESAIVIWYRVFLVIWMLGVAIEVCYRRWRMNGIMMACVLLALFLWAIFGNAYFQLLDPVG